MLIQPTGPAAASAVDGVTRLALGLLGLILVLLGVLSLVIGFDAMPGLTAGDPVLNDQADSALSSAAEWLPWVVLAAGVVTLTIGLVWVWRLLTPHTVGEADLPGSSEGGASRITTAALQQAYEFELDDVVGARVVRVRLQRRRGKSHLLVTVELEPDAVPADVVPDLTGPAWARAERVTGLALPTDLALVSSRSRAASRVS